MDARRQSFPVEYPPPHGAARGHESTLDVWADYRLDKKWLSLLIESKKNDPRFVDWVFLPARGREGGPISLSGVDIQKPAGRAADIKVVRMIDIERKDRPLAPIANEARELRGEYEDVKRNEITRTSTKAIGDAAYQVALATHAIIDEQFRGVRALRGDANFGSVWERRLFMPVIVTTANLYVADFDPAAVDPETGAIPHKAVALTPMSWLWYLYPVPRHLQFATNDLLAFTDKGLHFLATKLPIAVVRSSYLPEFLKNPPTDPAAWQPVKTPPESS